MGGEKVWLSRCGGYAPEELLRQMEEAFTALGVWEEIRPGMKVVLKPNLEPGDELQAGGGHRHPPGLGGRCGQVRAKGRGRGGHRREPRRPLYLRRHEGHLPGLRLHGHGQGLRLCPVHRM